MGLLLPEDHRPGPGLGRKGAATRGTWWKEPKEPAASGVDDLPVLVLKVLAVVLTPLRLVRAVFPQRGLHPQDAKGGS